MPNNFDMAAWTNFCAREIAARASETDRHARISREIWRGVGEHGYLQLFHKPHDGDLYGAMLALARACAATFWTATISSALCGRMLRELARGADGWIEGLASGAKLGCFAATESGSGSDPASYRSSLRRVEGGWELSGEKTRVANAPDADVAAVLSPAFEHDGTPLGLALAIVDLSAPGVARTRLRALGLRGMSWGSLAFDAVRLAASAVELNTTMPRTLTVVEWGQVIQIMSAIGAAEAGLEAARAFVSTRVSFGHALAENEAVRVRLGGAKLEIDAASLLAREVVAKKARGEIAGAPLIMAKIFATEAGVRACQTALGVCGGWGYSSELAVERLLRDALGNVPAGLPNERLRELVACQKLELDPWQWNG